MSMQATSAGRCASLRVADQRPACGKRNHAGCDREREQTPRHEKKVPNEAMAHPLTVLSMIGVNPAAAFNRDWEREHILNAGFETLFELNDSSHSR